jgi:quinol monooxygenase YgiN
MSNARTATAIGTFDLIRVTEPAEAEPVAQRLAALLRRRPGPLTSDIHLSVDGAMVVHCGRWPAGSAVAPGHADDLGREMSDGPGVRSVQSFAGDLAVSVDGADPGARAGVAVLAIRHTGTLAAARELEGLLRATGSWKREMAGFIGAAAYISPGGREFINYPRWTDDDAYAAYMADPHIAASQGAIASNETAPPQMIRCRPVLTIDHDGS